MVEMQDKFSGTGGGLSRVDSLSSLPETECDWPDLEVREPAHLVEQCESTASWQQMPAPPPPPSEPPVVGTADQSGLPVHMAPPVSFYQVAFLGGVEVRAAPDYDAQRTGLVLPQYEVFAVSHQIAGADGRNYLCFADGQGWVFDDSALVPHDPSVIQLPYAGQHLAQWDFPAMSSSSVAYDAAAMLDPSQDLILPPVLSSRPPAHLPPPPLHPAPSSEILASVPSNAPVAQPRPPSPVSWYRVAYLGGINLRSGPSIEAPPTGVTLPQMETFPVAEEVVGADGRVYLRLCDGRGWAFDDSALMPLDPSVKRGNWMPSPQSSQGVGAARVLQEVQADALPVRRRTHPQPRGKRGGRRCAKRAQNAASATSGSAGACG